MKASMDDILNKGRNLSKRKVSLRDRITCYRWTWFTMTMATGGVANVLYSSRFILLSVFFIMGKSEQRSDSDRASQYHIGVSG